MAGDKEGAIAPPSDGNGISLYHRATAPSVLFGREARVSFAVIDLYGLFFLLVT